VGGVLRAVEPGAEGLLLPIRRGRVLTGRVLDDGGAPVRGRTVRAVARGVLGAEDGVVAEGRTDGEGRFRLERLGEFDFRVAVRTAGSDWAPASRVVESGDDGPFEFRLRPGAALEGRVESATKGLWLRAIPVGGHSLEESTERVRPDGTFALRGLAAGPHRIELDDSDDSKTPPIDQGVFEVPGSGLVLRWQ